MRKWMYLIALMTVLSCNHKRQSKTGLEGKLLPSVDVLLTDSTTFNTASIGSGKPFVIFYFSPTCPYCRAELKAIKENRAILKDVHFYLLTIASVRSARRFVNEYKLTDEPNITVATDYAFELGSYFKIKGVPYNAIYNSRKQLQNVIVGKAEVEDLKEPVNIN